MKKGYWWQSCYIWSVWFEGPFGFGLLLSCRIVQAFQLYFIFVKKRLPPIRSYVFLPLILLPWISGAAFIHLKKPLNYRCQMSAWWITPIVCAHSLYVAMLMGFTKAIQHVEFRFHELKDLWRGVVVSTLSVGMWVVAYVLTKVHEDVEWIQVGSRFFLLIMTSLFVVSFFSISISQPLLSQMSLKKKEHPEIGTMGKALGIPDSGVMLCREKVMSMDLNEPLDKLLSDKRFRQSFMEFADSCLAGESLHFYDEVCELNKLPTDDNVRRIYMARHIVQKYIVAGAEMEVNISHRTRQQILNTSNLADPDLLKNAVSELLQLMKMNLARDYWSSIYYMKFRDEAHMMNGQDLELVSSLNVSSRLSSVHAPDDPFHQEHNHPNVSGL